MLISLEGVDGSGKSSLTEEIVRQLGERYPFDDVELLHSGPLTEPPLQAYVYSIDRYTPKTGHHIVADRWHYGEQVYGPIYRGGSAINGAQWRWMELWLASRGMQVTVVTNTLEEIERRLHERGEDFLQPEHVERVINAFNQFTSEPTYSRTVVVGGDVSIEDLAAQIIESAERAEEAAADINEVTTSYVGNLFPSVLFVGEKRGGPAPYLSAGAFMPVRNNSADYLWLALDDETWRNASAVNAKEELDLVELVKRLRIPVVALGKEAVKVLKRLDIDHGAVPHPQWVRRFHNKDAAKYLELIKLAILTQEDHTKWQS